MNPTDLLAALHTAERLKDTTRHCCTSHRRPESVAEHSWRIALMAFWLRDEFPQADMDRVIRMCLIHDLGECFTGDIPTFRKTAEDEEREERLLHEWVDTLPAPYGTEMRALYREMAAQETPESRIYKALDKFEAVIQHNESPHRHLGASGIRPEPHLRHGKRRLVPLSDPPAAGYSPGNGGENRQRKISKAVPRPRPGDCFAYSCSCCFRSCRRQMAR